MTPPNWLSSGVHSRGTNLRFTFDAARENISPVWASDGSRILYTRFIGRKTAFYQKASTGAGNEDLIIELPAGIAQSWSPDGQSIVYEVNDPKTGEDLWLLPLSGNRKPTPLVIGPCAQHLGQISPDGKWLAYESDETGRAEIYVIPFPAGAGKWQISNSGGRSPRWRRDGRELFFYNAPATTGSTKFTAVDITANASTLQPGVPKDLFTATVAIPNHLGIPYVPYAVSADGQRFLVTISPAQANESAISPPIVVVQNWLEDLKQRAPVH